MAHVGFKWGIDILMLQYIREITNIITRYNIVINDLMKQEVTICGNDFLKWARFCC